MPDPRKQRHPGRIAVFVLAGTAVLAVTGGLITTNPVLGGGKGPANQVALHDGEPVIRPDQPVGGRPNLLDPADVVPAAGPPGSLGVRLINNRINAPGLHARSGPCALPPFDASAPSQRAFYRAELSCLNATWEPMLNAAHVPFRPPGVMVVDHDVQTPCGRKSPDRTALYCSGMLYMTASYYRDVEGHGADSSVYLGQMAHEYGHHIQQLTGIMDASWRERARTGKRSPAGTETTRRLELQATCYGGMFLGALEERHAVDSAVLSGALKDAGERGDSDDGRPRNHGTPQTNGSWARQGFQRNRTYQCNTWLAAPEAVS